MNEPTIRQAVAGDCAALARLIGQLGYEANTAEVAARLDEMRREGWPVCVDVFRRIVDLFSPQPVQ